MNDQSVFSAIDVNRAYYALTDTPLPEGHDLDGENVAETMLGKSKLGRQAPIFFRRPPGRPGDAGQVNPDLAVRDGSDPQLYDIVADVSESNNLAGQFPDVVRRLKRAVFEWNAVMPPDAKDPNFEKQADAGGKELEPHQFVNATEIDPVSPQRLRVEVRGHHVTALHNGREALTARDATYAAGQVGLCVVGTHAVFSGLRIEEAREMFLFGKANIEKLKAKRNVRGLLRALRYRKDSQIRWAAAEALGEIGGSHVIERLVAAIKE